MQQQRRIALILTSVLLTVSAVTTKTAEAFARSWMQRHQGVQPKTDELAELKAANPSAYAIVQALLTKRSLGLLDPRHPTASFAKAAPVSDASQEGPEAFTKFASPAQAPAEHDMSASQESSAVYPAVSQPAQKNWLNWRPASSAADDDAMVNNVLSGAADATPKKNVGLLAKREATEAGSMAKHEKPEASPLSAYEGSLSMDSTPHQIADPARKPTSSLSAVKQSTGNYLSSFSWDDNSKSQDEKPVVGQAAPQLPPMQVQAPAGSSLMSWLGMTKKQQAPQEPDSVNAAVSVTEKPVANGYLISPKSGNAYLMDLQ